MSNIRSPSEADLVLFDPMWIQDLSTFEQPQLHARGIHTVFVNGLPVWAGDRPGGNLAGGVLVR